MIFFEGILIQITKLWQSKKWYTFRCIFNELVHTTVEIHSSELLLILLEMTHAHEEWLRMRTLVYEDRYNFFPGTFLHCNAAAVTPLYWHELCISCIFPIQHLYIHINISWLCIHRSRFRFRFFSRKTAEQKRIVNSSYEIA